MLETKQGSYQRLKISIFIADDKDVVCTSGEGHDTIKLKFDVWKDDFKSW
jgi:hypothetical protein